MWIAVALSILSLAHWGARWRRDIKGLWINLMMISAVLAMSLVVSTTTWLACRPLGIVDLLFRPLTQWMYDLM